MTWAFLYDNRLLFRGSYAGALDYAEAHGLCERAHHADGTELAPRLNRGCMLVPLAMLASRLRRAA